MSSVVLVGQGNSLRGSRLGRKIDNHETVIRMQNYCIYGYEKDVGTKRTEHWRAYNIRLITKNCIPPEKNKDCHMLFDNRYEDFDKAVLWPIARTSLNRLPELSRYRSWIEAPQEVLLDARIGSFPMKNNPSSGLLAILYAMSLYDQVDICGLDCLCNPSLSSYGYYFAKETYEAKVFIRHDFKCEHECIKPFIDNGRIRVI